jgi:hypothetical protein
MTRCLVTFGLISAELLYSSAVFERLCGPLGCDLFFPWFGRPAWLNGAALTSCVGVPSSELAWITISGKPRRDLLAAMLL